MSLINNCAEFHISYWAALELNCTLSPMATKSAGNKDEIEHLLEMISPPVLLVQDSDIISKLSLVSPTLMSNIKLKIVSPLTKIETPEGWKDFTEICENGLSDEAKTILQSLNVQRSISDTILLITTLGTTLFQKAVHIPTRRSGLVFWAGKLMLLSQRMTPAWCTCHFHTLWGCYLLSHFRCLD